MLEWLELVGQASVAEQALQPDGYLMLVEDHRLPVGELPHPGSFLVLSSEALKALFKVEQQDEDDKSFVVERAKDAQFQDRLITHLIRASLLTRADKGSLKAAIEISQQQSADAIRAIRSRAYKCAGAGEMASYKQALEYAFQAEQFATASLALKDIEGFTGMRD